MYKSKWFKPQEFACRCGCGEQDVTEELLRELDTIREHFGAAVSILSGRRCVKHNRKVGGAVRSQHLFGTAADIVVAGVSPSEVHRYLVGKYSSGGIGKYNSFTHFDVREGYARW